MREVLQGSHFPHFSSSAPTPHPPLTWSPLSQWARVFEASLNPNLLANRRRFSELWVGIFQLLKALLALQLANFLTQRRFFRHRSGRLNSRASEKNRDFGLLQKKSASLKNPTTLSKDHHKKSVHPIAPQRSQHPHLSKTDNQRNSARAPCILTEDRSTFQSQIQFCE